jgi:hypothetical protein
VPISDIADYSMISSAAAEKAIGMSMPSALAVCSTTLVGSAEGPDFAERPVTEYPARALFTSP